MGIFLYIFYKRQLGACDKNVSSILVFSDTYHMGEKSSEKTEGEIFRAFSVLPMYFLFCNF